MGDEMGRLRNAHLAERIRQRALQLGFHAVGCARADEPLDEDFARYESFVERGMQGRMRYLARHVDVRRRLDTPAILAQAKTVVCVAWCYARGRQHERADPPLTQHIARYARGRDYHRHVRRRLQQLAAFVRGLGDDVQARAFCDTAPVLERAWAARAGLGFVGKNGLLVVPGLGSYTVLGEVVTSLALPAGHPVEEQCRDCDRCLTACPTQALAQPYVVDPRRCVSYLTIELRAPVAEPLRAQVAGQLFGCDDCQQVCPLNEVPAPPACATGPFRPLDRWSGVHWSDLLAWDEQHYRAMMAGSPLRRATRAGLARNAVLLAWRRGRVGEPDGRPALDVALRHDDASVRELARWARGQGGGFA